MRFVCYACARFWVREGRTPNRPNADQHTAADNCNAYTAADNCNAHAACHSDDGTRHSDDGALGYAVSDCPTPNRNAGTSSKTHRT